MAFDSLTFLAAFLVFFAAYHLLARGRGRLRLLAGASLLFYAGWGWRGLPVLAGIGLCNYLAARAIVGESRLARRRAWLAGAALADLGTLVYYYRGCGLAPALAASELLLPVGLSFYALQGLSYAIDAYRGSLDPKDPLAFFSGLAFFPRLPDGPLVRWRDWLAQSEDPGLRDWADVKRGLLLISFGLVKKSTGAFLMRFSDALFAAAGPHAALEAWTGALAFAGQLYGTFSGYTDIAVGLAALLGFSVPKNFDRPYLSATPLEFWRRWHISLYAWLYEYVYLPLALANRPHLYLCLMATVLSAGLWHGLTWNFAAYGAYHAVIVAAASWGIARLGPPRSRLGRAAATVATFYLVVLGFVIFRVHSLPQFWQILRGLHGLGPSAAWTRDALVGLGVVTAALALQHALDHAATLPATVEQPALFWPAAAAGLACAFVFGAGPAGFTYIGLL